MKTRYALIATALLGLLTVAAAPAASAHGRDDEDGYRHHDHGRHRGWEKERWREERYYAPPRVVERTVIYRDPPRTVYEPVYVRERPIYRPPGVVVNVDLPPLIIPFR